MIDYGKVRSTVKPESIVIDDFSVWQHTNIQEVSKNVGEENEFKGFEFNMVQCTKDEYMLKQAELSKEMESMLSTVLIGLSGEDAQGGSTNEQG